VSTPTVLDGRYELMDRLGSGGMSNVYRSKDQILERTVAVKVLAEHLSDDDRFVARFRREALAVAKLIHPNIVQVYDTGVDNGRHFIVMECVEGRSGAQILKGEGVLDPEVAVEIGVQACAGLEYAHRHGIVHRDVKPGDVYALGVVLYQFLTGRLPYEGSSLAELAVRQQNEKPLSPRTYNAEVPETVSASVMRALEGDNRIRFQTAGAFSDGLERGLRGEDVTLLLEDEPDTPENFPLAETATRPLERTSRTAHRPAPPPPRYKGPPARPTVKKRSAFSRVVRFFAGLLALIAVALVVAGLVIFLTDRAASVEVRDWAGDSVNQITRDLKDYIRDNTQ